MFFFSLFDNSPHSVVALLLLNPSHKDGLQPKYTNKSGRDNIFMVQDQRNC